MKTPTLTDDLYRTAATHLYGEGREVTVPQWSHVQRVEGGAFVELVAWVPDAEAEGQRQAQEFNRKPGKSA